ncbi:CHAT domain-containing protein [Lacisediminihabitans sp. H27-G8]|uniref:CHAT domain-containing protein n=1 Tax=Lacisediminihabitans sp. H27-G8 TaxID=3111909 RepID=UPI0038FD10BD
MLSAAVLYQRGVAHSNAGRHASARTALDEALRRSQDAELTARIIGTVAYLESETGDPDRGIALCRSALEASGLSTHTRAVLGSQIGLIELRRGNVDAAVEFLTGAISQLDSDPARLGVVLLNRGLAFLDRRDVGAAGRDFDAAAEAFERAGDPVELAKARNNQGYAAMLAGDLIAALRLMDESRPVLAALSPVALATCDADRAEVLLSAGMTSEAIDLLATVARTYGLRGLRQAQAEAEFAQARALVFEDARRAAALARRAARRFRARGSESWALRAEAFAFGATVSSRAAGSAKSAGRLLEQIEQVALALGARHFEGDAVTLRLQGSRLRLQSGDAAGARSALDGAPLTRGTMIGARLLHRQVGAELAVLEGRRSRALSLARTGLDELAEWQSSFGSLDLQSALVAHGTGLITVGIRQAVATGRASEVFEWSERTRNLTGRIVPLRPPANAANAADLAELRQLRASDPSPLSADGRAEAALRSAIRARQWEGRGSGSIEELVTLDRVQAELGPEDSALLAVLWSGERLTALAVTGDSSTVVDLGPLDPIRTELEGLLADLDMAAATLSPAMQQVVDAGLAHRLDRLDSLIVGPVRDRIGTGRLVVTPPGVLAGLPWSLLPTLRGRPLTLPVSATRWLAQRARGLSLRSVGFAAGPGVARAEEEVTDAAAGWATSTVLVGAAATSEAVSGLAQRVDLLHLSAHGRHSADNPLFSGVLLADGPWFGYDVDQLPAVPTVVVLSACEVGRSAVRWGQEALGMSQAWLHAGVRCVIAAPASVDDSLACELLTEAHGLLASGVAPADALVAAGASSARRPAFQCYGAGW